MTPEHLQEIRHARLVRPEHPADILFHLGLAQGHRSVLLEAYDAALERIRTLEAALRDISYATAVPGKSAQDSWIYNKCRAALSPETPEVKP